MTTATMRRNREELAAYSRIVSAHFEHDALVVVFANGDEVFLPVERFTNPYIRAQALDWARASVGSHEVVVPSANGDVGIPWDAIRALVDPEFEAQWAMMGRRVAESVGAGLRQLRLERGLSPAELAERAGVPDEMIQRLESGNQPAELELLDRVLQAMNCTMDDLRERA